MGRLGPNPERQQPGGHRGTHGSGNRTSLHAEQHFTYHWTVRPGDVLTVETREEKTGEKEGRRSGRLAFREVVTEYRNPEGELVVVTTNQHGADVVSQTATVRLAP